MRSVLAAVAAAFFVLGGHFWMIDRAGSPVPVHDQWLAEGEMLYVPLMEHRFSAAIFLHPHSEHIIAPTRILALGLFELNRHVWDVRLQMTVNAFLAAALAALVVIIAARQLGPRTLVIFAAVSGGLLASPLFYGNALWGFQSQFYFLLLFAIAHLDLVLSSTVFSLRWWLGILFSLLACVSMGSGFFSAAVVFALSVFALLQRPIAPAQRRDAWANLAVHGAIVAVVAAWLPKPAEVPFDLGAAGHTLVHCLSWPQRFFTPWGAWVWLPFAVFALSHLSRRRPSHSEWMILALGAWVLLQILAISLRRNSPTVVITPRYYEIFWLGLVANTLALDAWIRRVGGGFASIGRGALAASAAVWLIVVITKAGSFAESHRRYDLPAYEAFATSQINTVRAFLNTGKIASLQSAAYPYVPHPDSVYLARMLANPTLRSVLPTELTGHPAPFLERAAAAVRRSAIIWMAVALILFLCALSRPRVLAEAQAPAN